MCGIVGYVGARNAQEIVIDGLEKLEYRGYDSSGIATVVCGKIDVVKKKGRLEELKNALKDHPIKSNIAIGHTRWATHGEPSDRNAHPHTDLNKTLAVVHNGIIENYMSLKNKFISEGETFSSDTDTEVIAHFLAQYKDDDLTQRIFKMKKNLTGSYALGIIFADHGDTLVAVRKQSPLIIGLGENENFIASDIPAILEHTGNVIFLEDGDSAFLKSDSVKIYDKDNNLVERKPFKIEWGIEDAEKNGFAHFMLKEIFEQPNAIRQTLSSRLNDKNEVELEEINFSDNYLQSIEKISIIACGSAYHAGCVGKKVLEQLTRIPVSIELASEFRYQEPLVNEKTLLIAVSQSGETADTIAAVKEGKSKGAKVLAITNVIGSSISREADNVFYTHAGPEISVASTKAYITQLIAFYLIAIFISQKINTVSIDKHKHIIEEIKTLPEKVEEILNKKTETETIAKIIKNSSSVFYIGRGMDWYSSMEAALKLKEISYIVTESFAAGELKHGTIALIEKGTPVITIASQGKLLEKTLSNMQEVKTRGAELIAICSKSADIIIQNADIAFTVPDCDDMFSPVLTVVPAQLIAYYTAIMKGNDVDKPRNLAKSVTVE